MRSVAGQIRCTAGRPAVAHCARAARNRREEPRAARYYEKESAIPLAQGAAEEALLAMPWCAGICLLRIASQYCALRFEHGEAGLARARRPHPGVGPAGRLQQVPRLFG